MERLKIYIINLSAYVCGQAVGTWLQLPYQEETKQAVFQALGIDENHSEYFIADYESTLANIQLSEYTRLEELNQFAMLLEDLSDYDYEKLAAVIEAEAPSSVAAIIELIEGLDDYEWLPDVQDEADLGEYYVGEYGLFDAVPEHLRMYLDAERLGRDLKMEMDCTFTSAGIVIHHT